MITSVSILAIINGTAAPLTLVKGFISKSPHVGDGACDCSCGRHRGACKMGSRPRTLATDEAAIGPGHWPRPRRDPIAIRRHTQAAAGLAPLETRLLEHRIQAFGFGGALDLL